MRNYENPTKKDIKRLDKNAIFFRIGAIFWTLISILAILNSCQPSPYPTRTGIETVHSSVSSFPTSRPASNQYEESELVNCYCSELGDARLMTKEDCKRCSQGTNMHPELGFDPTTWSQEKQDRIKEAINFKSGRYE